MIRLIRLKDATFGLEYKKEILPFQGSEFRQSSRPVDVKEAFSTISESNLLMLSINTTYCFLTYNLDVLSADGLWYVSYKVPSDRTCK